jgi:DNA-binding response OmpR family regulator
VTASVLVRAPDRRGSTSNRYHPAVPDVLLATDADWIADECEAALGGTHVVHRVWRGVDVLPAVRQVDPALVLLDLQIGNMGGMATCMAIRQEEGAGRLEERPVLMLLDRQDDTFLARHSDADGWLVKPVNSLQLQRAVSDALADFAAVGADELDD